MPDNTDAPLRQRVRQEIETNDPPIVPGQVWVGKNGETILRRVRILAKYPAKGNETYWIYENLPGGFIKSRSGELGKIPEFNLRYVMRPE